MPYKDPEKQREYQREWHARRRAAWLLDKACVDCGSALELEIDHVDPSTKVHHNVWSWATERREDELSKCVVRCADCHHDRHGSSRRRHGIKRYEKGCRCEVCRAAKSASNARHYENRKAA